MTVKVEVIEGGIPHTKIMLAGLVCTIVCLYLSYLNVVTNTGLFSFFGGLAAIAALIWGSHTIKVLCSYGIGTRCTLGRYDRIRFRCDCNASCNQVRHRSTHRCARPCSHHRARPGYLANDVLNMKIPVMIQSLTKVAVVGALTLMGFAVLITGQLHVRGPHHRVSHAVWCARHAQLPGRFIGGALTAVAFLLGAIAIQHPFNACLSVRLWGSVLGFHSFRQRLFFLPVYRWSLRYCQVSRFRWCSNLSVILLLFYLE